MKVTTQLLKQVGASLNLRHNPDAWLRSANENLSKNEVQVSDAWDLQIQAARLVVTCEGRPLAEVSLNRPRMILGRDSTCDISLDSNYLSRYQNLFMETEEGWVLIDLNSTNGCFVNGRRIREHRLRNGDVIGVGQHQLQFTNSKIKQLDVAKMTKEETVTAQIRADNKT